MGTPLFRPRIIQLPKMEIVRKNVQKQFGANEALGQSLLEELGYCCEESINTSDLWSRLVVIAARFCTDGERPEASPLFLSLFPCCVDSFITNETLAKEMKRHAADIFNACHPPQEAARSSTP